MEQAITDEPGEVYTWDAEKTLEKIKLDEDEKAAELILAKVTGNFIRGNERSVNPKNNRIMKS